MRMNIIRKAIASVFVLTAFLCQSAYAVSIDKIIMFGDSLSDNGNVYSITKTAHDTLPLIPIIPQEPVYYHGRFSNGPVWIENLASSMNVELKDFAYGGSWVEPITVSKLSMPISLSMQVNFYLVEALTDTNIDKHLYVIWAGGNDYIKGRSDIDEATTNTVKIIKDQLDWLRFYGAKNFLVLNLPDLSVVPQVVDQGSAFVEQEREMTTQHNRKLAVMIKEEQIANPGDKILFGDLTSYMDDVISNPAKYHLKNVSEPCFGGGYFFHLANAVNTKEVDAAKDARIDIMNNASLREAYLMSKLATSGAKACDNPDEYLFWDHLHPTRMMHLIISTTAKELLYENGVSGKY